MAVFESGFSLKESISNTLPLASMEFPSFIYPNSVDGDRGGIAKSTNFPFFAWNAAFLASSTKFLAGEITWSDARTRILCSSDGANISAILHERSIGAHVCREQGSQTM